MMTSFTKRPDEGWAESPCRRISPDSRGTGKLPFPWLGLVGCTPLGQSDRVSNALDEVFGRAFPCGRLITAHKFRPHGYHRGAGRESNPLNHVLHHGIRACFRFLKRTDEGMAREQRRTASGALRYATATCAGGTCTHITRSNVLRTGSRSGFNGRRSICQSVIALPLSYAPMDCSTQGGGDWIRTNNRCTPTGSRPLYFSLRPNEVVIETFHFQ